MKDLLYIFLISMAIIVTVVLVVENSQSQNYPPYRDNGKQIALLLEVCKERDGTSTAKILDFSRKLHTEEGAATLHAIISYYQLEDCTVELYQKNLFRRRITGKRSLYKYRHVKTIPSETDRQEYNALLKQP